LWSFNRLVDHLNCAAYFAAALVFASAAISLFWTPGGSMLLDTVGGAIEELARTRSAEALCIGHRLLVCSSARLLVGSNVLVSLTLLAWGSANVFVGTLVLTGVISPTSHPNEWVLRWHVFVWDLWFAVSGAALAIAIVGYRRARYGSGTGGGRRPSGPKRAALWSPKRDRPGAGSALQDEGRHPFRSGAWGATLIIDPTSQGGSDDHRRRGPSPKLR
jgi:hypothetical protein